MGKIREGLANFLLGRKQSLVAYKLYYDKALAAMASNQYKEPEEHASNIADKITNILYNKDYEEQEVAGQDVSEMGMPEIKDLWKDLVGEEWPNSKTSS
jgi:hypothetical protein